MAQIILNGRTTLDLGAHLDPMFTELYQLTEGFQPRHAAWASYQRGVDFGGVGNYGGLSARSGFVCLTNNLALNASNDWIYKNSGSTGLGYYQVERSHIFFAAVGGSAGSAASIVQQFSIDEYGVRPGVDSAEVCGAPSYRWSVVYASTGAINTSDAREKTAVTALSAAELAAARDLSAEIGTYQFLAAVAAKGAGVARRHAGLTVQRAMEIMAAHGLDAERYGFICHDTWAADEAAGIEAGDRYGFRVDELLLFLARGFDARLRALEAA